MSSQFNNLVSQILHETTSPQITAYLVVTMDYCRAHLAKKIELVKSVNSQYPLECFRATVKQVADEFYSNYIDSKDSDGEDVHIRDAFEWMDIVCSPDGWYSQCTGEESGIIYIPSTSALFERVISLGIDTDEAYDLVSSSAVAVHVDYQNHKTLSGWDVYKQEVLLKDVSQDDKDQAREIINL
jgi:hypothetical protein